MNHLTTIDALRAVADGKRVPSAKYGALVGASLIKVIGHGAKRAPRLTEAGKDALRRGKVGR